MPNIEIQKPKEENILSGIPGGFDKAVQEESAQKLKDYAWKFYTRLIGYGFEKNPRLKEMFFNEMSKDSASRFLYEMDAKYEVAKQAGTKIEDWDEWAANAERMFDKKKDEGQVKPLKT